MAYLTKCLMIANNMSMATSFASFVSKERNY